MILLRMGALLTFLRPWHHVMFFWFFTFLIHLYARRVTLFLRANLFANLSINSVKTVTCLYSKNRNVCLLLDCDICGAIWKTLDGSSLFAY